jgi:nitrogen regulatory protein P-II 1
MIKIEAIIKPFKLDAVKEALSAAGISGLTVTPETRGFGRQKGQVELFHGAEIVCAFLPKVKIEVIVPDGMVDRIISVIQDQARTGNIGDGKIFVSRLSEVVRVRTGEHGNAAI